jgi:hypothetical protein
MLKTSLLIISVLIAGMSHSFAQTIPGDYQKACIQEQLADHKGIKGGGPTAADFKPYCSCLSDYVAKNVTNQQLNELAMDAKAKPEWLKAVEDRAMKSCLSPGPKITT